jgi:hypothetical protein
LSENYYSYENLVPVVNFLIVLKTTHSDVVSDSDIDISTNSGISYWRLLATDSQISCPNLDSRNPNTVYADGIGERGHCITTSTVNSK